jgi:hypothetical protein
MWSLKVENIVDRRMKRRLGIFVGLFAFHLSLSILLSCIARSDFLSSLHNGQGFWIFALDSSYYHEMALQMRGVLQNGDYGYWWAHPYEGLIKWISLSYALITSDPLVLAPIYSLAWVVSVICVYRIAGQLFFERRVLAFLSAVIFGLWPSYLFHSTQLLKDPIYTMGILLTIWGWLALLLNRRAISLSILVGVGVLLAYLVRPHILEPLFYLSLLAMLLILWRNRSAWKHGLFALVLVSGLFLYGQLAETIPRPMPVPGGSAVRPSMPQVWHATDWVPDWLESRFAMIGQYRDLWIDAYPEAGSNIDNHVRFHNVSDVVKYLPRALQIGFLAPFPPQWFQDSKTAGRASRLMAGIEMVVLYLLLPGFFYFFVSGTYPIQIRIWLLIYSTSLVLLTTLVVTNMGALYRMRFVYLLPILIGGLGGWAMIVRRWRETGKGKTKQNLKQG